MRAMAEQAKPPGLARNLISQAGLVIAIVALANLAFLIVLDATQTRANPYLGILAWIVAPAILIFGLAVYFLGMLIERRRRRKRGAELAAFPVIDLNRRRTRIVAISSIVGIIL